MKSLFALVALVLSACATAPQQPVREATFQTTAGDFTVVLTNAPKRQAAVQDFVNFATSGGYTQLPLLHPRHGARFVYLGDYNAVGRHNPVMSQSVPQPAVAVLPKQVGMVHSPQWPYNGMPTLFVNLKPYPQTLKRNHTVLGYMTEGADILKNAKPTDHILGVSVQHTKQN